MGAPYPPPMSPETVSRTAQQRVRGLSAELDQRAQELEARRAAGKAWGKGRTILVAFIVTIALLVVAVTAFVLLH